MTRALTTAALVLAVLVSGCGSSDDKKTIPSKDADRLVRLLQDARVAAGDQDRCDRLEKLVGEIQTEVGNLSSSVDSDTRQTIVDGVNTLEDDARSSDSSLGPATLARLGAGVPQPRPPLSCGPAWTTSPTSA